MARFDLTDAEWEIIEPLMPGRAERPRGGRPRRDDRRVLNGIFSCCARAHRGATCRSGTVLHDRLQPVQSLGEGGRVGACLRDARRPLAGLDAIDRQLDCPRAPARRRRKGADHAIGRSRGGLSTKINARVDGRGLPVRLTLTAGQAHDRRGCRVVARPAPRQRRRRRPQLRQPVGPRADRGGRRTAADPSAAPSSRPAQRRPGTLSPAQSRRGAFSTSSNTSGE